MEELSNGELGIMIRNLDSKIEDIKQENKTAHENLDKKVTATNGRVKALELWRMFLIGAWTVLTIVTPLGWYIVVHSFSQYQEKLQSQVSLEINKAIQDNNSLFFEKTK